MVGVLRRVLAFAFLLDPSCLWQTSWNALDGPVLSGHGLMDGIYGLLLANCASLTGLHFSPFDHLFALEHAQQTLYGTLLHRCP